MSLPIVVLVPTHGRPTLLDRTLATIAACDRPAGYAECVVVENGPRVGAEDVVADAARQHPAAGFRYLHYERANKSAALNAALAAVSSESLCVFFDDDIRVEPGALMAYAQAARQRSGERAYFGGPFGVDYEDEPPAWVRELLPWSAKGASAESICRSDMFLGFNWAAQVGPLLDLGGFDPGAGPGSPTGATGQESDMQRRLRGAGFSAVCAPGAFVWHYVPVSRSGFWWALQRRYKGGVGHGRQSESARPLMKAAKEMGGAGARLMWSAARLDKMGAAAQTGRIARRLGVIKGVWRRWREPGRGLPVDEPQPTQ